MDFKTTDLCDQFASQAAVCEDIFTSFGGKKRFSGPIATVRVFEDNVLVRKMIETVPAGTVLVVDGGGSKQMRRSWGPAGRHRGGTGDRRLHHPRLCQGYGGIGPDGHRRVGFGESSAEKPQGRDGAVGEPVRFAGVDWLPGHHVYVDEDGVVLFPQKME